MFFKIVSSPIFTWSCIEINVIDTFLDKLQPFFFFIVISCIYFKNLAIGSMNQKTTILNGFNSNIFFIKGNHRSFTQVGLSRGAG